VNNPRVVALVERYLKRWPCKDGKSDMMTCLKCKRALISFATKLLKLEKR
jgi:hypothetical protein